MSSHLRGTLVMVMLGGLLSCSRASSTEAGQWSFPKPKVDRTAWQAKCDRLCEVHATAKTLDALCPALEGAARSIVGAARCEVRRSIGYPVLGASAVRDVAILELVTGKARNAFVALQSANGWQIARSIGSATTITPVGAEPVDLPGIEPAGVKLTVALIDGTARTERVVVCGVAGDGATRCPVAVDVASNKSSFAQMGANLAGAVRGAEWRADLELTPSGFVATKVSGDLPDGLAGEHRFDR
jgi:hypothetical protein